MMILLFTVVINYISFVLMIIYLNVQKLSVVSGLVDAIREDDNSLFFYLVIDKFRAVVNKLYYHIVTSDIISSLFITGTWMFICGNISKDKVLLFMIRLFLILSFKKYELLNQE